jgi:hypothetical protein
MFGAPGLRHAGVDSTGTSEYRPRTPLAQILVSLYTWIVSGSFQLEPLLRQLAAEFARRDMKQHLELLRAFYRDHRARQRAAHAQPRPPWTENMILEWLLILQIPPFEHVLPTLTRGAPCPSCRKNEGLPYVACVFPGGRVRECRGCGGRWLGAEGA